MPSALETCLVLFSLKSGYGPASGQVQHRKSAIHGLPVILGMFRVSSVKSDWFWSQSIVFTRPFKNGMSLDLARGRDSWCWLKGARPLGTEMVVGHFQNWLWFLRRPEPKCRKLDASGKKGKLLCCKCLFHYNKANLTNIQPWKSPKCPRNRFWQNGFRSRSHWVMPDCKELISSLRWAWHTSPQVTFSRDIHSLRFPCSIRT